MQDKNLKAGDDSQVLVKMNSRSQVGATRGAGDRRHWRTEASKNSKGVQTKGAAGVRV